MIKKGIAPSAPNQGRKQEMNASYSRHCSCTIVLIMSEDDTATCIDASCCFYQSDIAGRVCQRKWQ